MSKKKIIAIDIDDTIVASREGIINIANKMANANLGSEDYDVPGEYWSYYTKIWEQHGLNNLVPEEVYAELHQMQSSVPLLPGAEFAIKLLEDNFDIVLITAWDPKWEKLTSEWLKKEFGDFAPRLYFSEAHLGKDGAKTKGQICKDLGALWLIDDNAEHCRSVIEEGLTAILFGEYGWHIEIPQGVVRCKDWQAVLNYFDKMKIYGNRT